MKVLLFALLTVVFLTPAVFAVGKSNADQEREMKNAVKSAEKAEAQKKQEEEQRLKTDPKYYFAKRVEGKYGIKDGRPIHLLCSEGKISQIVNKHIILFFEERLWDETTHASEDTGKTVAILVGDTSRLTDDMATAFTVGDMTGTYQYVSVAGVKKNVILYEYTPSMTYEQFLDLKERKVEFPASPENQGKTPAVDKTGKK